MRKMDLTGNEYGLLTVVAFSHRTESNGMGHYFCKCSCGNPELIRKSHGDLRSGKAKHCAASHHRSGKNSPFFKHGMKHTKVYKSWCKIKERCDNENDKSYPSYGAVGIKLASEFYNFLTFYEEVGDPPENTHLWSIDRIDNSKGYVKVNIKWSDSFAQSQNKGKSSNNTTGFCGMQWYHSGKPEHSWYAIASWRNSRRVGSGPENKKFNVNRLGVMQAFTAALEYRENTIKWLRTQGESYALTHGKD